MKKIHPRRFAMRPTAAAAGLSLAMALALAGFATTSHAAQEASKAVPAGATWTVAATTRLAALTIADGAHLAAPAGNTLTLTVDGVETAIAPGHYQGQVVLSVAGDYIVPFDIGPVKVAPYRFRTAVLINDGRYVAGQSAAAAAGAGATVTDRAATGLAITSHAESFNGVVVAGDSVYTIDDATIDLVGNGANDFAGVGAAILSAGHARVTVDRAHIRTRGAVRTALFIGEDSTMTVNDSDIETFSGTLPDGYRFSILPGQMMEVPYGLGVSGNVRATNLIGHGTVYYNNTHVVAHGWGALSSDGDGPTRMFVDHCLIETIGSGYGAFSNGDAHDHFSHTTIKAADYGLIMGGNGSGTFTDATVVNAGRIGVMMHQGSGGSVLTVDRKSVIESEGAGIEIKGRGADVIVDDAQVHAGNGVIVQTMDNDDPIMLAMMASGPPGGGAAPPPDMPGQGGPHFSPDVRVTLKNGALHGDLVHAMTHGGEMKVTLQAEALTGAISSAVASPASGIAPTRETLRTIGEVKNAFGGVERNGVQVALDGQSTWTVDKTSYLNDLTLAQGAAVVAPKGFAIEMSVDGVRTPIRPGAYGGRIVLRVTPA